MARHLRQFTNNFHYEPYPAIDPSLPQLSCKDKTVIITTAEPGNISSQTAIAFARASAAQIALIGPVLEDLESIKSRVLEASSNSNTNIFLAQADITSPESLGSAAHSIRAECGAWDVFVHTASHVGRFTTIRGADEDDWWKAFETNVRPLHFIARHFLTKCRPQAVLIVVNDEAAYGQTLLQKASAFSASRLAALRVCDYIAAENGKDDGLGLRLITVCTGADKDDGVDERSGALTNGASSGEETTEARTFNAELPAHFFVWCASDQAKFLKGRHVWANWDVEELIRRKEELESNPALLRISLDTGR